MKLTFAVLTTASLMVLSAYYQGDNSAVGLASAATAPTASTHATQPARPTAATHRMKPGKHKLPTLLAPAGAASVSDEYQMPPFPISNVDICDKYASEARRCLNKVANSAERHASAGSIDALLKKVTSEPGQRPNEWLAADCRRGLDTLKVRYPQCDIQKQ